MRPIFTAMNLGLGKELFNVFFINDLPRNSEELANDLEFYGYAVIESVNDYITVLNDAHGPAAADMFDFHDGENIYDLETGEYCGPLEDLVFVGRYSY